MSRDGVREEKYTTLVRALERLRSTPPRSRDDLQSWYAAARDLEANLVSTSGLGAEVPEFLWHYLADADIRLKDASYGESQDQKLELLIQYLKRSEMPTDENLAKY